MAKSIKSELWIGTRTNFLKWGEYPSRAAAKRYIKECGLTCYTKIIPIKKAPN